MSLLETAPDYEEAAELTDVSLKLDVDASEMLLELMHRTGLDASELVGRALGAYWRELEGVVLPAPPEEDIEQVLAESEEDVRAGRTSSNEDVFARIATKHGW
jgi:hypothetical protein